MRLRRLKNCSILALSFSVSLYATSIDDLKLKVKDGNISANCDIGICYYKGKSVRKNLDLAMLYFKRAAIYDDPKARYNIASIYANKHYRHYNKTKAFDMFLSLAKEDYPPAQDKVGLAYLYGFVVQKDYSLARKWFEVAYFENNYLQSGCNLAYIYTYGKGVIVNLGRARKVAQKGYNNHIPRCIKVYDDFKLYKYKEDKGFKFGYYAN